MADVVEIENSPQGNTNKVIEAPTDEHSRRYDRAEFITLNGTNMERDGRGREIRRGPAYVEFGEKTQENYSTFLHNQAKRLINLDRENPDLLNSRRFLEDKMLFEQLTTVKIENGEIKRDRNGREIRDVDDSKITEFLSTSQGWTMANMALERKAELMTFAMALKVSNLPEGSSDRLVAERMFRNGIGRGRLMNLPFFSAGRDPRIPIFGRGGETRFTPNIHTLNYVKSNDALSRYMFEMTGINVDDFTDNGAGGVVENGGIRETKDIVGIVSETKDLIEARIGFYKDLGVDPDRLDASPVQRITRYLDGMPEQIRSEVESEVDKLFNPNYSIIDINGRTPFDRVTQLEDPLFDRDNIDMTRSIQRLNIARREVFLRIMRDHVAQVESDDPKLEKPLSSLKMKLEQLNSEDNDKVKQRTESLLEQKSTLEKRFDEIEDIQNSASLAGSEELKRFETGANDLNLGAEAGKTFEQTIQDEQLRLRNELDVSYGGGDSLRRQYSEILSRYNQLREEYINTAKTNEAASLRPKDNFSTDRQRKIEEDGEAHAQALVGAEKKRLEAEVARREERLEKISELYSTHQNEVRKAEESRRSVTEKYSISILDFENTYLDLVSTPGTSINDTELDQLSIEDLYRLSTMPGNPFGNPTRPTSSQAEEIRRNLIQAKAERRAQVIENATPSTPEQLGSYDYIISGPVRPDGEVSTPRLITNEELLTLSNPQLLTILENPGGSYGVDQSFRADTLSMISRARTEAQKQAISTTVDRFKYALEEEAINIKDRLAKLEQNIEMAGDISRENNFLEKTIQVIEDHENVFERAYGAKLNDITDNAHIDASVSGFSEAEKHDKQARGYYEILNILYDYQEKSDREDQFKQISQVLPPDKLANILNSTFRLGLVSVYGPVPQGGPTPATIDNALSVMRRRNLSPRDIRNGMKDVIIRLKDEASAL